MSKSNYWWKIADMSFESKLFKICDGVQLLIPQFKLQPLQHLMFKKVMLKSW